MYIGWVSRGGRDSAAHTVGELWGGDKSETCETWQEPRRAASHSAARRHPGRQRPVGSPIDDAGRPRSKQTINHFSDSGSQRAMRA